MIALLAATLLLASPAAEPGGPAPAREPPAAEGEAREGEAPPPSPAGAGSDEELLRHLELLENLQLLENLELFDPAGE